MNQIKMKSIQAGPNGVRHRGAKYDIGNGDDEVTAAEAKLLVSGGFAEYETATVKTPKPGSVGAKKATMAKKVKKAAEEAKAAELDKARKDTCKGCELLPDNCVGVKACEKFDDAGNPVPDKSGSWGNDSKTTSTGK
ncbi:hypothetical protein KAR91_41430 [Candidatus Pacearchaeota archaeon]|nr:hypothetical protein [Candidatus Pacearchaeota archaeon]